MDESELARRAQAGDFEAFELLIEPYQATLARTAYLMTGDRSLVQDVVQEALISAWRGMRSYRDRGNFRAWLWKVLVNQAHKQHRRRHVETVPLDDAVDVPETSDGPERAALRNEESDDVRRALDEIGGDQREALVLRYYSELTVPEIAKVLGCREGTVKSRLSRGLERLQAVLGTEERVTEGEVADERNH